MLPIQKKIIKYNQYPNNKPEYCVIHDTGNSSPSANADAHFRYFGGGNRGSSAHYFVDTKNIIQIIEDNKGSWAVGDGKGKFGIHNRNNISIEACINDPKNMNIVTNNTIDLAVYIMKKYNIPLSKLVRHY